MIKLYQINILFTKSGLQNNCSQFPKSTLYRGSCTSAPVLLNLLNLGVGETDKMLGKALHLILFPQFI